MKIGLGRKGKKNKENEDFVYAIDFTSSSDGPAQDASSAAGAYDHAVNVTDQFGAASGDGFADSFGDAFNVSVRNREHMLSLRPRRTRDKLRGLITDAAPALVLAAAFGLLLEMAEEGGQMIYALAGVAVYVILTIAGRKLSERSRRILFLALIGAAVAALIVFRKYIGNGLALIMNQLYDLGEQEQAYVYSRWPVGETGDAHPNISRHAAVIWLSSVLGCLLGVPGSRHQRCVSTLVFGFTLFAFAYYGMTPSVVWAVVMVAAMIISAGNGRILSSWPLFIAAALVMGGIIMLDPGENYAVSAFDENFRDIFAARGGFFENVDNMDQMDEDIPDDMQEDIDIPDDGGYGDEGSLHVFIIAGAAGLAVLAGILLLHRYFARKRRKNRAGMDSPDANTAIGAMFPYAVKWLRACGVDVTNRPFSEIGDSVREKISGEYADEYAGMHDIWKEAAFSEHALGDEQRTAMNDFVRKTIRLAKSKAGIKEKFRIRYKYAL